ncbi:MAG TPA: hypothetical protein VFV41_20345 [Streptosporangiaceae bacterium]|nr:hypothetical protein [Streptosporangiaceae bacterium]
MTRPAPPVPAGRLFLGWEHALTCPEPGPRPGRPPAPPAITVDPGWQAARRREARRLARPARAAAACCAAATAVSAAAGLGGLLPAGLAWLAGAGLITGLAASLRTLYRDSRDLRAALAAEERRVAGFRAAAQREQDARLAEYARRERTWRQRRAEFARQPQWFPVRLPAGLHRVDVAGGTLAGWSALLTSVAAPRLAAGAEVTVLDLTEGAVAGDLLAVARACGIDPLVWVLPADLHRLDLGAGLPPAELADVLATAVSAGVEQDADPAADAALLGRVLEVLGPGVTIARLTAALRALAQVGDPRADVRAGLLTAGQLDRLAALFGRAAADQVVVGRAWAVEARLRPLEQLGRAAAALPRSPLRLAWLDQAAGAVTGPVLASFLTVALTHALRRAPAAGEPWQQMIVVLGAERLSAPVLDRLTDACETAGAGLIVAYRSLPAHVAGRLGRGNAAVAFMRLGNAQDARAAAEQIGTEHRLVISQLTQTVGDSVTVTTGDSYTSTVSTADSLAGSASVTDTAGRSSGRGTAGGFAPFAGPGTASRDRSASRAVSGSLSVTEQVSLSTAWGASTSRALGASTSLATGAQRSREFLVEQHELQQLPPSAVLLTYAGPGGRQVVLADANPAIAGLPGTAAVSLAEARARPPGRRPAPA